MRRSEAGEDQARRWRVSCTELDDPGAPSPQRSHEHSYPTTGRYRRDPGPRPIDQRHAPAQVYCSSDNKTQRWRDGY